MSLPISFFKEGVKFTLPKPRLLKSWIADLIHSHQQELQNLNFIFCTDDYLLEINKNYLNHHTLTDVVTFDLSEGSAIDGEIYISIERIRDNAKKINISFEEELRRVMAHGVLHLLGYNDKTEKEKEKMIKAENAALERYNVSRETSEKNV